MARSEENRKHTEEDKVFFDLRQEYRNQVKQQVAQLELIGTLRGEYRDVHRRIMTSECELRLVEWQSVDERQTPPEHYWKFLELGPVMLTMTRIT